ncbi:hypothetical protein [Amycolatopsis aidingensis]|uniref:hypothetical protein n=1 Tax=Amycolatopsis aidingensis TaxID=2842453 RepID=UPI001C0AB112|nr:hypothetical protein [Amycolatopsis aidingensis]
MSTWRDERRKDRAAEAEQKRADQLAEAEAEAVRMAAMAEANRAATEQEHERERARAEARRAERAERAARRRAVVSGLRRWAAGHVVELLIYPIALVSFVLAAPAMAAYGSEVYRSVLGAGLPLITELGMWAFAVAVQVTRHRTPQRPVWALQVGVWTFSAVAFGLNLLHGLTVGWSHGVVMGVVAVAGVVAHQLTVASPPRSRAERAEARIARLAERKTMRVRRAAVRQAVAEIDADGCARLLYAPGRYVLGKGRALGRRTLVSAIVPGLPIEAPIDDELAALDRELSDLLAADGPPAESGPVLDHGPVATLDDEGDQSKSSADRGPIGGRVGRSMEQLHAELRAAIEADPAGVDPTSAESIRRALRCAPKYARQLRDEYRDRKGNDR